MTNNLGTDIYHEAAQSAVAYQMPEDHPLVRAWQGYKASSDYANSRKWAAFDTHRDGSMWAAFSRGWDEAVIAEERRRAVEEALRPPSAVVQFRRAILLACGVVVVGFGIGWLSGYVL